MDRYLFQREMSEEAMETGKDVIRINREKRKKVNGMKMPQEQKEIAAVRSCIKKGGVQWGV